MFGSCVGQSDTTEQGNRTLSKLDSILKDGVIRVGNPGDFNPMTYLDPESGEYVGYYVDVVKDFAADMGVEVEWVQTTWRDLVSGITADKYDLTTGASFNMGRARAAAFTLPIAQVGTVPLTLKANAERFTSWESIDTSGVRVAVTLGTVFDEQSRRYFPQADIVAVEPPARDYQEVLAERADVSITSTIEASTLIQTYPQLMIITVDKPRNQNANGMILGRDEQEFLNYVNVWITMKQTEGYFTELSKRWNLPTDF